MHGLGNQCYHAECAQSRFKQIIQLREPHEHHGTTFRAGQTIDQELRGQHYFIPIHCRKIIKLVREDEPLLQENHDIDP